MDPFSIATGSAGLVSLGITICDGLLTYCRTYKSRENDLSILADHAGRLQMFLEVVEKRLRSGPTTDASFRATVMECLGACENCVSDVQALNGKYSQIPVPSHSSTRNRGKAVLRKLQYPFEAERFDTLRKQLTDFHSAVSGLLVVMNYDLTDELRRNVDSHSTALASAISLQGSELSLQMALMGPSITHALDEGLEKLEKSIQIQFTSLGKQWANSGQDSPACQSILNRNVTQKKTALQPQHQSAALFDSLCSCSANSPQKHECGCFRSFQHKKVHIIAGKFKFFSLLLQFRLQVHRAPFSFSRDLSVYPNFSIRSTVDVFDSEAFKLVFNIPLLVWRRSTAPELEKTLRDCLMGLRKLFEGGKAWPTDITTHGKSLLHVACHAIRNEMTDDTAAIYLQYLKELINLGVPMNDVSELRHDTPLSYMMYESHSWSMSRARRSVFLPAATLLTSDLLRDNIARELMEYGAALPAIEESQVFGYEGPHFLPMLHRGLIAIDEGFGYGDLSRALIQRSETCVRRLLSRSQSHVLEKGRNMESPLHVATPWPKGIELLLQLGGDEIETLLNAPNAFGESPLDYALKLGQLSSVELLVNANAEIDLESTINIERSDVESPQFDEIIDFLCQTLADRRKRMLCHAREWLPMHEIARFRLEAQDMLQDTAFEVSEVLRHQENHVSQWFRNVQPGSIYHSACLSMNLARSLLKVGFQSPSTTFHGFTPLMTIDLYGLILRRGLEGAVDLVTWFFDYGANLHSSIPVSGVKGIATRPTTPSSDFKVVHRIADAYGKGVFQTDITAEDHLRVGHVRAIISDSSPDSCICYCSPKGCTPSTLFIRKYFDGLSWGLIGNDSEYLGIFHQSIEFMAALLTNDRAHEVATDIIRIGTFERLGMKHTCCKYIGLYSFDLSRCVCHAILADEFKIIETMDSEEVVEIQEEDQYLALRLKSLVAEFTAKYDEQKDSFHDFFFGYWWKRMDDEVEAGKDEPCTDCDVTWAARHGGSKFAPNYVDLKSRLA